MRTWWTGEDSNLRSPQGAADLQSAGFSHSPTRPRKNPPNSNRFVPKNLLEKSSALSENTKRTRVKRHQPVNFEFQDSLRLTPLQNFWWSWRRELNPRPSDYKSDALPAELRQRRSNRVRIPEEVSELQVAVAKYPARRWPALWKNACPLTTWTPANLLILYSLAQNPADWCGP